MNKYSVNHLPAEMLIKLAENHRELRKRGKCSQQETAERSGVSLGSLKRFESTGQISMQSYLKLLHLHGQLNKFATCIETDDNLAEIKALFSNKIRW